MFKPRNQWHTFWNAGDEPCETIELISPAGFEDYFRELAALWPDQTKTPGLLRKYELDMDSGSVAELCARYGLVSARPEAATDATRFVASVRNRGQSGWPALDLASEIAGSR